MHKLCGRASRRRRRSQQKSCGPGSSFYMMHNAAMMLTIHYECGVYGCTNDALGQTDGRTDGPS